MIGGQKHVTIDDMMDDNDIAQLNSEITEYLKNRLSCIAEIEQYIADKMADHFEHIDQYIADKMADHFKHGEPLSSGKKPVGFLKYTEEDL
jgi:hypothetical protein